MTAGIRAPSTTSVGGAALSYARAGYRVFPVAGKQPLVKWSQQATTDPETIQSWWQRWPDAGVAVATGNGLLVVDVDVPHGAETLIGLQRRYGALPDTAWIATPSGGWHVWFTVDRKVPNTARTVLGDGIDTRGDGGYVVAPPSVHPGGGQYRWHTVLQPPTPAPRWLVTLLTLTERPRSQWTPPEPSGRAEAALAGAAAGLAAKPPDTGRNHYLYWAACRAGERVAAGQLDREHVHRVLGDAAQACGLSARAAEATINSGLGRTGGGS